MTSSCQSCQEVLHLDSLTACISNFLQLPALPCVPPHLCNGLPFAGLALELARLALWNVPPRAVAFKGRRRGPEELSQAMLILAIRSTALTSCALLPAVPSLWTSQSLAACGPPAPAA